MSEKMKKNDELGLTLIEILASITIFSIIAISLFSFFPQAYKYTTKNQSRTLEINVARGVLHYVEQQDYDVMKNMIERYPEKMVSFDSNTICNTPYNDSLALFPDQTSCSSLFKPTLNNHTYTNHNIQLFIVPYTWTKENEDTIMTTLKDRFPSKKFDITIKKLTSLREKRDQEASSTYPTLTTLVYVDFNPTDQIPGVLLEGSITSEVTN
jgi:type II secretory pathway pseudopilin PulG